MDDVAETQRTPRASMRRIWLASLIMLLIIGCGQPPPRSVAPSPAPPTHIPTPTKPRPDYDWFNDWLRSVPCQLPCVEGLTPGITTPHDAVATLEKSPRVGSVRMSLAGDMGKIEWEWIYGSGGGVAWYPAKAAAPRIDTIVLFPPTNPTMQAFVRTYGPPSHVIAERGNTPDDVNERVDGILLVYLPQGFDVTVEPPTTTEAARIQRISAYMPLSQQELSRRFAVEPYQLVPWDGFKDFLVYCRAPNQTNAHRCDP